LIYGPQIHSNFILMKVQDKVNYKNGWITYSLIVYNNCHIIMNINKNNNHHRNSRGSMPCQFLPAVKYDLIFVDLLHLKSGGQGTCIHRQVKFDI